MFTIIEVLTALSVLGSASTASLPQYLDSVGSISDIWKGPKIVENANGNFYSNALIQPMNHEVPKVVEVRYVTVTGYSSTADQTDSTPFIAASGKHVYDGMAACNFLGFGTKIRLPELSEAKVYEIGDRMALKNSHKIDIWFATREEAMQFGVKRLKVEILAT